MAKSEDTNKELSIEELKKMSGGMGLDRLGTQKGKGKKKPKGTSLVGMETGTVYVEDGALSSPILVSEDGGGDGFSDADNDFNDTVD